MTTEALYLAELVAFDPSTRTASTLRYASGRGYVTTPSETPASTHYDARIKQAVNIRRSLFSDGKLSGRSRVGYGDLVLYNGDGALDALLGYAVEGRAVTVRRGTPDAAYPSGFTTIFSGTMEQVEVRGDTLVVKLRDKQMDLLQPLQPVKYAGSNALPDGLEGVAGDLKGKPKPICLGQVYNAPIPCVNTAKLIYQVADTEIETVDAVYDSGVPLLQGFPMTTRSNGFGSAQVRGLAYGRGLFVAVGASGTLQTSPDGSTWTTRTSSFSTTTIVGVAYANDLFVAVGDSGKVATSPDGITWTQRTSTFGTTLVYAATYGNGLWVIVGDQGKLATSPDGVTWTARTSGFGSGGLILGVVFGNGRFVAVGQGGVLATSADGIVWALGDSGVTANLNGVTYGGGRFVAVGTAGALLTSPDGITWTAGSSGFGTGDILAAFYGQSTGSPTEQFVVVGVAGLLATSADGITWSLQTSGAGTTVLYCLTHGDGRFVAGGNAGFIASSGAGPTYPSLAALEDDTQSPDPGSFRPYYGPEGTYVRLGASPYGQITADATEGAATANRTAAQLFVKVLQRAGKVTGDWSASDVTALDTAASGACGYWTMDEVDFADALDAIAASPLAWWGANVAGVYRIQQLSAPAGTAALAITANDIAKPLARLAVSDATRGLPPWRTILRYQRNYAVQVGAGGGSTGVGSSGNLAGGGGQDLETNTAVIAAGSTVPRTLAVRFGERQNVKDHGALGDGSTDDTAAILAAVAAAGVGGVVYFPPGTYKTTSAVLLDSVGLKVQADGYESATLIKYHTGNAITVDASGIEIRGLAITAATGTSATYAGGAAIRYETDSNFPLVEGVNTSNIDIALDFAADGGKYGHFANLVLDPYTQTAGSEGRCIYLRGTDTNAMHRRFVNCVGQGIVDFGEVFDSLLTNCIFRRPVWTSAASSITLLDNCVWGALDQAMTINGSNTIVRGCRFAGNVTLSSGMSGACAFTDNIQTSGTFTDSTSANVCLVRHHPLSVNYHMLDKHKVYSGSTTGGVVRTGRTIAPGDADYTWTPYEGVSDLLYNTTLTAVRTITASMAAAHSGAMLMVRRTAGGAFLLDVAGLVSLAPYEWACVVYDGSSTVLVAAGKMKQVGRLDTGLLVGENTMTGTSQYGILADPVTQSGATSNGFGVYARCQTAAAAFTQSACHSLYVDNPVAGAGSTITTAHGLRIASITAGGTTNYAIRTGTGLHSFGDDIDATGGYRQTIDGWYQDNVTASQTNVELTRAAGRFRAVRAGSVTGVIVTSTEARTAGTLTVTVYKNTGLAGAAGSTIGLTAVLDGTNTSRKATTQARDTDTFAAGDEIYVVVTTDGSWTPTTADIRVAVEIED